jgi:hypothetical protein
MINGKFDRYDSVKRDCTLQIMLTTLKLALLLMTVGFSFYLLFSVLGISTVHYRHIVTPSLVERIYPLKIALKVNTTKDTYHILDAFHNIQYDPYDLFI